MQNSLTTKHLDANSVHNLSEQPFLLKKGVLAKNGVSGENKPDNKALSQEKPSKLTQKELEQKWNNHVEGLFSGTAKLSPSSFKAFCSSPKDYKRYRMDRWKGEFKVTKAIKRGSIVDGAVLGKSCPYKILEYNFEDRPDKRLNPKGKEMGMTSKLNKGWLQGLKDALGGEENIVEKEFYDECMKMAECVWQNQEASELLSLSEYAIFREWDIDGIPFKGEVDIHSKSLNEVSDLKTCTSTKFEQFRRTAKDRMYIEQVVMYIMGYTTNPKGSLIAVDPNFHCEVFSIDFRSHNAAERLIRENVRQFKRCLENDLWHEGYGFYNENGRWFI